MTQYYDYQTCVMYQQLLQDNYTDQLRFALRNYSCWYFAYTICKTIHNDFVVYFMILYKPISILYKLSGMMMTLLLLAGYGVCISNIVYTNQSVCKTSTMLGKVSNANAIIFLVVASLMLLASHLIIWLPLFKQCC